MSIGAALVVCVILIWLLFHRIGQIVLGITALLLFMFWSQQSSADELVTECLAEPQAVMIKFYDNKREMRRYYQSLTGVRTSSLQGFATKQGDVHTLHVMRIKSTKATREMYHLGHELLHAMCGDWHPEGEAT